MLLLVKIALLLSLFSFISSIQINLDFTGLPCDDDRVAWQHDCIRVPADFVLNTINPQQIVTYCLSQCPSQFIIAPASLHHHRDGRATTFEQLAQQQITSQQLYRWSASISVVEEYQLYLNQLSSSTQTTATTTLGKKEFYNCTWPRFGSSCQYSFDHLASQQSSLSFSSLTEAIHQYYSSHPYKPTSMTCFTHLKCNRGPEDACLDWSEICDGKIDCIDGGQDEKECWKLEMNECEENKYRCVNGQCIPKVFARDGINYPDCLDSSDEAIGFDLRKPDCSSAAPIFACEDVVCSSVQQGGHSTLTSSCVHHRKLLLMKALFSIRPAHVTKECWLPLKCAVQLLVSSEEECEGYCYLEPCPTLIQELCNDTLYLIPSVPILYGHLHFVYDRNHLTGFSFIYPPRFVCYNHLYCNQLSMGNHSFIWDNLICQRPEDIHLNFLSGSWISWIEAYVAPSDLFFRGCGEMPSSYYTFCNDPHLYRCINSSKCTPRYRLLDGVKDCFYGDDEQIEYVRRFVNLDENNKDFFHCTSNNRYIANHLVQNGICDCSTPMDLLCDDEQSDTFRAQTHISFQTVCDGFPELRPIMIDGHEMTDETDCEYWKCNNTYTRCDDIWNCFDGADEVGCDLSIMPQCLTSERHCILPDTPQVVCMSAEKMNDGRIDCYGATDEPKLCRIKDLISYHDMFYCIRNNSSPCLYIYHVCNGRQDCLNGEDEQFCLDQPGVINVGNMWTDLNDERYHHIVKFLQRRLNSPVKPSIVHFSLTYRSKAPETQLLPQISSDDLSHPTTYQQLPNVVPLCHRGLPLRVSFDPHNDTHIQTICLCPSSFYGPHCQHQNERVSLTLQFRALSDSLQILFGIIVLLIDHTDERVIHSSQQLTYLSMRDCQMKYNLHLLYSTRPKNGSLNHSVQIDIYEKFTFIHRATYLFPILLSFLPVHRMVYQLDIPSLSSNKDSQHSCDHHRCNHGECRSYINSHQHNILSFCQCHQGWSGEYCTQPIKYTCASDSLYVGLVKNTDQPICLCLPDRFGPHCLITNDNCHNDGKNNDTRCYNGGECIPSDPYIYPDQKSSFTCICPQGYTGDRCEKKEREIIVSFDRTIPLSQSMLVHFILYNESKRHEITTTFRSLPIGQESFIVYWSQPFHLLFIELFRHQYYLAHIQPNDQVHNTTNVERKITIQDRCAHVRDLLNDTIARAHLIYRIKFYHIPCQRKQSSAISCFYDDVHLCLCTSFDNQGQTRVVNCFEFDHEMKSDCAGQNACENDGQCFQDHPTCPHSSMCVCPACFYGRKCQFSMNGFALSLDAILGYQIRPSLSLHHQSALVQVSMVLIILISVIGVVNGVLSLMTFQHKKARAVGCGYFLFGSSVTTLLTMMMLLVKYWILVMSQIGSIHSRSLMHVQCLLVDFLLRISLNMDQWLNACVAVERMITIIQGTAFNKKKSRQTAKYAMFVLFLLMVVTVVHDPIHRRLIDDDNNGEEKRVWCTASYPAWIRTYDTTITMLHFLVPFTINLLSAILIIWTHARQRTLVLRNLIFQAALSEEFRQHKHLLITPIVIVILALPRLIISVISGCRELRRNAWVYLAGYLMSFITPMLTFALFVIPSQLYKDLFGESLLEYRRRMGTFITSMRGMLTVQR